MNVVMNINVYKISGNFLVEVTECERKLRTDELHNKQRKEL